MEEGPQCVCRSGCVGNPGNVLMEKTHGVTFVAFVWVCEGWMMLMSERYFVGTEVPGYGGSWCVVLAVHAYLKGEARACHSLCRWKMSQEE